MMHIFLKYNLKILVSTFFRKKEENLKLFLPRFLSLITTMLVQRDNCLPYYGDANPSIFEIAWSQNAIDLVWA